jgi:hypothetical protein
MMAKEILSSIGIFSNMEIDIVCKAIYNHSSKETTHSSFDEVLINADVLQHCLYNPLFDVAEHERVRFEKLKNEFSL